MNSFRRLKAKVIQDKTFQSAILSAACVHGTDARQDFQYAKLTDQFISQNAGDEFLQIVQKISCVTAFCAQSMCAPRVPA